MNKSKSILVIVNPAARSERAGALVGRIRGLSRDVDVRVTTKPGEARALAASAAGKPYRAIVAAGGDGTVNEVVNGLAGSPANFGILPIGTMNVFAAELGLPQGNLEKAWEVIEEGHTRPIDLPCANGGYFVQLAGIGLDAEVVSRTSTDSKNALGPLSYLITLAQVAARKPPKIFVESADGVQRDGSFVLVGNGRYYGGPFVLFKDAKPDDGLLDVLVFQNQSHWDIVRYVQAIAFGAHPELHDVEYFQTASVRLTSEEKVPVEADGELIGNLPCDFRISPTKLNVLSPGP